MRPQSDQHLFAKFTALLLLLSSISLSLLMHLSHLFHSKFAIGLATIPKVTELRVDLHAFYFMIYKHFIAREFPSEHREDSVF